MQGKGRKDPGLAGEIFMVALDEWKMSQASYTRMSKQKAKKRQPKNREFFLITFWILSIHRVYKIILYTSLT